MSLGESTPAGLEVAGLRAAPGQRTTGLVELDLGPRPIRLPLVLVNGARPGRRVGITAGIHGAEYVSIAALRRVIMDIDPAEVSGAIVAVLTANPVAFEARSIYLHPLDARNLNRVFPGDPAGGPSDRLAAWLLTNVIAPSGLFIDMHCGDMNEALVPFTGMELTDDAEVDALARTVADAYGLDYLVVGPLTGSTTSAAADLGIAAVLGEVGGVGQWPERDVAVHAAGLRRALIAAGVLPATAATGPAGKASRLLTNEAWLRSDVTGYWHPRVAVGDMVSAGQLVGEVRDAFNVVLRPIEAPIGGVVLFLVTSLAMNEGDPLLAIGSD
ncbi:MAG: succinylglutamate desuccinylase/aspartoacylase family protein [Candidatus Limnocylindrales bacterium]